MFENGSLLRRRKRFKLHKPDKEMLKTELQALASAMPPPRADLGATGSIGPEHASIPPSGGGGGGLSPANLHRLREDLMRWEMQERRMMLAAAAAASQGFPGAPECAGAATAPPTSMAGGALTCPSYYLLSPEARQRLVEGAAGEPPTAAGAFETAALLQSAASWGFSSFGGHGRGLPGRRRGQLPGQRPADGRRLAVARERSRRRGAQLPRGQLVLRPGPVAGRRRRVLHGDGRRPGLPRASARGPDHEDDGPREHGRSGGQADRQEGQKALHHREHHGAG